MTRLYVFAFFLLITLRSWSQVESPDITGNLFQFGLLGVFILNYKNFNEYSEPDMGMTRSYDNHSPQCRVGVRLKTVQKREGVLLNLWWFPSNKSGEYRNGQTSIEVPSENVPEPVEGTLKMKYLENSAIALCAQMPAVKEKGLDRVQSFLPDKANRIDVLFSGKGNIDVDNNESHFYLFGMGQQAVDRYHLCSFYRIHPIRDIQVWMMHSEAEDDGTPTDQQQYHEGLNNEWAVSMVDPQSTPASDEPDEPTGLEVLIQGATVMGERGMLELMDIAATQQGIMWNSRRARLPSLEEIAHQEAGLNQAISGVEEIEGEENIPQFLQNRLEDAFSANNNPTEDDLRLTALGLDLSLEVVARWFSQRQAVKDQLTRLVRWSDLHTLTEAANEMVE
ncbi:hypothetical protein NX722_18365 [Endozoicomonas gorgoniicola]|uniref:Homeobox domain-containing protein n=1 Tax=Endozoicomonas gorgoniicola TaxID=1234144 RepID=A0ABT3MYV3_9GAMM|nr:hypothetical protein [Endozoicomonas gorgoniicola]MCW7554551.1 hypothetical protein [Endozoicomonas gorgoniicola]